MTVAPNGGRKTKADHPALPLSADELARTAAECLERGASMIHLHVRDADGKHILDADAYRGAIARIDQEVGDRLVLQVTSESLGLYSPAEQRSAVLRTNPEAVSLALRELAPRRRTRGTSVSSWASSSRCGSGRRSPLCRRGGRAARGDDEARADPVQSLSVLYVLGRFALTRTAIPRDLLPFVAPDMPRFHPWSVCAFGRREAACVTAAALLGGHARVGFENNLTLPTGARAASTASWSARPCTRSRRSGLRPRSRTA